MPPAVDLALTKSCPCLAARRRARAITRHFDAYLRPHGLRSTQFSVLAALALRGPTGRGRLADGLGLERTTLTRSAATLERQGWIETRDTDDGRERPLALTVAGRRALDAALPAWKEAKDRLDHDARP
jgi:DNA-binding MarR family transcriptional regulator